MFKDLKIRTKIVLMPILAGIAFLLILVINTLLGSKNNQLLVNIEEGYFPALEMSRELESILASVQRNMQYAASAMDEEILSETDLLRDNFKSLIENSKDNPILNQSELLFLENEFSEYYPMARQTTLQMLNGELDEEVIQNLAAMQEKYNLIQEKLSTMTSANKNDMAVANRDAQANQESIVTWIIVITLFSLIIMLVISIIFIRLITKPLHTIVTAANQLAMGNVNSELHIEQNDEIGELAKATTALIETNKQLSRAADAIGQGDYNVNIDIRSDDDILGKSILHMKNNLLKMSTENEHDNWLKTGQADLSDKMRGDQNTVDLAQSVISYIAKYTSSQIGTIYLNLDGDKLKLAGSYAYKKRKNLSNEFAIGEGLVGQCALEKEAILITDIPDDYIQIKSGIGERTPLSILVTPLIYDDKVHGVIELGAFHEYSDLEMNFIEQATENIAIAFNSAVARVKVKELLEETQNQASELQAQQEELRVTNEELEEQTQNLLKSEEELKAQREELQASNEELETQTEALKERQAEIEEKNNELEIARVEIEQKAEELELSSKYKSEFLANMSHELRTPLNSIQILSKLLMENKYDNLNDKQITF
ncbi:MAG: GAF domain-containing protein, partial [Calditrichaceae bacterium]